MLHPVTVEVNPAAVACEQSEIPQIPNALFFFFFFF